MDRNIPNSHTDFHNYLDDHHPQSIYFKPTRPKEICDIVKTFKNCKAPGIDEFRPRVIKSVIPELSEPLCHIFNLSLSKGIFPQKLKLAKVSPVFKSGNKEELTNYRPISVLSVFSKILERIVYKRTMDFLNKLVV